MEESVACIKYSNTRYERKFKKTGKLWVGLVQSVEGLAGWGGA